MKTDKLANIKPLSQEDLDRFFSYLDLHLAENGKTGPLFQPASRGEAGFPSAKWASFVGGLTIPIGELGWRRAWIAEGTAGDIIGHIDLRGHRDSHTAHRALLGMGVRRDSRRSGIGEKLVIFALNWAKETGVVEVIDLSVLSNNLPAIKLYEKLGFMQLCKVDDMFRIDGKSEGNVTMMLRL